MMEEIIVIVGATASGKTRLAIDLAKEFDAEIVSADSMQIYKGMDIGTAKPTKEEQSEAVHHMIDVCPVTASFSTKDYVTGAEKAIADIRKRGKNVIVAGGTGMYTDALMGRMSLDAPKSDEKVRSELTQIYENEGIDALYEIFLREAESEKERIHKNDVKRIMRAIERSRSGWTENQKKCDKKYKSLWFALDIERNKLYNRIDSRVDKMFQDGLVSEVEQVLLPVRDICTTSLQGIGYKEVLDYLDNNLTLEEAKELIKKRSRNYAKRQLTWFRRNKDIQWLSCFDAFNLAKNIIQKEGF
jgi:tRNA dimethylallyltransferase